MRILKYLLGQESVLKITDPVIQILSVKNQNDIITVWALVNDDEFHFKTTTELVAVGTGWHLTKDFLDHWFFVDTVIVGSLVWHVFERKVYDNYD